MRYRMWNNKIGGLTMKKNENMYEPVVSFKEQTPEMLIGTENENPLYEKAFLSTEDMSQTEYAKNTTAWD